MLLVSAKVGPFKSINTAQTVQIDDEVTVLVGMNEAGKTVFLQALEKSNDALGLARFNPVHDYPRKDLPTYLKQNKTSPAQVTKLTYRLTDEEIAELNDELHTEIEPGFTFSISHNYSNNRTISISVDEQPVLKSLIEGSDLSSDTISSLRKAGALREIPEVMKGLSLTEEGKTFLASVEERIAKAKWDTVVQGEVWEWLAPRVPKFLYFSDYELLPSKMNLADLAQRGEQAQSDPKHLEAQHRAVLALLRMAQFRLLTLPAQAGTRRLKQRSRAFQSILPIRSWSFGNRTRILEVEVDIKPDHEDVAPYNSGPNLYLRIKNRRHRGVSTDFRQRSRGFIWFFSFLVWFDSVQHQLETTKGAEERDFILLLDEPGLSLHALAQEDFLRYIDTLSERHQVLYTTHSPFMVHSDRLDRVRTVEDQDKIGTVISENVSGSDPRTIFPLQAALGWTIAQNLFISERNLLVEGPADLIYLKSLTGMLEAKDRVGLREDITIVPVGGLDKVATFVALLGANGLKLAVLHDFRGAPEQRLVDLVKDKMISPKALLNASQFRISRTLVAMDTLRTPKIS